MGEMQDSLHRMEELWARQFGEDRQVGHTLGNWFWNSTPGFDRNRGDHRGKRLELPLFEGENPFGWLFRAKRYFAVNGIAEGEKVFAASVCLEGQALNWFQWIEAQTPFKSWRDFRTAVLRRFGRAQDGDPTEARFEQFAATSRGLPDAVLRGAFLNGLREEVRSDVKILRPVDLQEAMSLTQEIEERNDLMEQHWKNRLGRLQVLLLAEDDSNPKIEFSNMDQASPNSLSFSSLNLSLNSLMGITSSHSMKVRGQLGSWEIVVLIDSGASHSFIAKKLVQELGLLCEPTTGLGVRVGNGMSFKQEGVSKGVQLDIQGFMCNVVLGVTWLRTLGMVSANWEQFTVSFWKDRAWVTLKGDPALCHEYVEKSLPPKLLDDMELLLQSENNLRTRCVGHTTGNPTEFVVKGPDQPDWGGFWGPVAALRSNVNLEDKVLLEGRSNLRSPNIHVCDRRGKKGMG
ncbi:hypothetical protein UlMin_028346 [Ulmus minor]